MVFIVLIQPDFNKQCYIQYYILYLAISGTLWPNSTNSNDMNFDKNQRMKEEELLKKFSNNEIKKDNVNDFSDNESKKDESKNNGSKIIN